MAYALPTSNGSVPDYYDRCLGAAYFDRFAERLARRLAAQVSGQVLEIACGTGLLTRHLCRQLDADVRLVATDLSQAMLRYAQSKLPAQPRLEWGEADASALPYSAGSFDALVCSFGFMFAPDRAQAFSQARRVLKPGGILLFSVWDRLEDNPHAAAAEHVVQRFFGHDPEMLVGEIAFSMHDPALLRKLLTDAGFQNISIDQEAVEFRSNARTLALGMIRGTPRSLLMEQRGAPLEPLIQDLTAALADIGGSDPYCGTARAVFVQARAGRDDRTPASESH